MRVSQMMNVTNICEVNCFNIRGAIKKMDILAVTNATSPSNWHKSAQNFLQKMALMDVAMAILPSLLLPVSFVWDVVSFW